MSKAKQLNEKLLDLCFKNQGVIKSLAHIQEFEFWDNLRINEVAEVLLFFSVRISEEQKHWKNWCFFSMMSKYQNLIFSCEVKRIGRDYVNLQSECGMPAKKNSFCPKGHYRPWLLSPLYTGDAKIIPLLCIIYYQLPKKSETIYIPINMFDSEGEQNTKEN